MENKISECDINITASNDLEINFSCNLMKLEKVSEEKYTTIKIFRNNYTKEILGVIGEQNKKIIISENGVKKFEFMFSNIEYGTGENYFYIYGWDNEDKEDYLKNNQR